MFQSQYFLPNKGALRSIWVAAYCLKRLQRDQIVQTDIPSSVDKILIDEWPSVTYRILAYLLLGVVRIYSKKVEFVLRDCREISNELNKFLGKKKAISFREIVNAQDFSVTLPERYELDAFNLEYTDDVNNAHIANKEDIMLRGSSKSDRIVNCSVSKCHGDATATVQGTITPAASKTSTAIIKLEAQVSAQNPPESPKEIESCSTALVLVENCMEIETTPFSSQFVRSLEESFEESIEQLREIRFSREECLDLERFYQSDKEHFGIFKSPRIQSASVENSEFIRIMQTEISGHFHSEAEDETRTVERICYSEMPSDNHDYAGTEEREANFTVQTSPDLNMPSNNHKYLTVEDEGNFTGRSPDPGIASDDHICVMKKITIADSGRVSKSDISAPVTSGKQKLPLNGQTTPDLKIPDVKDPGSTEHLAVRTPANMERVRKANKRKCIYDDLTVLSNQTIKQNINDTSDLLRKRRRVPHTIAVWRQSYIHDLPQKFMEPLIPCNMSTGIVMDPKEIRSEANKGDQVETVEAPHSPIMDVSSRCMTDGLSAIAPGTPVRCSTSTRAFLTPRAADSDGEGPVLQSIRKESLYESIENARRDFAADSVEEITLDLMDKLQEMAQSGDNQELDCWSTRTRTIAKWLHQIFASKTKCNEAKTANLSQILDGKTRKESARVFYEILVLRSGDYVNVSQEGPYKDILLQETRRMERKLAKCSV